jgi:hypothetical protein
MWGNGNWRDEHAKLDGVLHHFTLYFMTKKGGCWKSIN